MHLNGGSCNFLYRFLLLVVIEAWFLLWWIASTCLLMINTFCIISIHRAKQFPSNFRISTLVPDVEDMFIFGWDFYWPRPLLSVLGIFFFHLSSFVLHHCWTSGRFDKTCCGVGAEVYMRKYVRVYVRTFLRMHNKSTQICSTEKERKTRFKL